MKRIMSACIEQTNRFECDVEYQTYTSSLEKKNIKYKVIDVQKQNDNSLIVKIKKQYNSYDTGDYLN